MNNVNLTTNNILNTNENTNLSNSQNNVGNVGVKSKHNSNNNIHLPNINQYKPNNIVNPSKKSSAAANDLLKKTLL
jgi:type 1 fimbria pilin